MSRSNLHDYLERCWGLPDAEKPPPVKPAVVDYPVREERGCYCSVLGRMAPCSWCEVSFECCLCGKIKSGEYFELNNDELACEECTEATEPE